MRCVALLAEGVDRNIAVPPILYIRMMSPSSRRAWIEIPIDQTLRQRHPVALLAEGVDRNSLLQFRM